MWYPVEYLKIRGTWGEAFQAPTLQALFSPPDFLNPPHTPAFFAIFDPLNPAANGGPFVPVFPVVGLGGNPNLKPQVSDNISFGFDVSPPGVPGLYLSLNYNRTDFTDKISSIWDALGYPGTLALENAHLFPGLVERNAEGVLTFFSNQDGNLSGSLNESVDVEVRMEFQHQLRRIRGRHAGNANSYPERNGRAGSGAAEPARHAPEARRNCARMFIWTGIGATGRGA